MAGKRRLIIPIFIPFAGCPHRCIYCNQERIASAQGLPTEAEVVERVDAYLSTWRGGGRREIAFYGGTFTALPEPLQRRYLSIARRLVKEGRLDGIRISTRPDAISPRVVELLSGFGVGMVELGAQSMVDSVLRHAGRGHSVSHTVEATGLLKEASIDVGIQLMPGLPADTEQTIMETTARVVELKPSVVRIYPTLVIRDTPLEELYRRGDYTPWELEPMVRICARMYRAFKGAGIRVIRMGLQYSEALKDSLVAGPYHPAFGELVKRAEASLSTVQPSAGNACI